jgi:hypothetical protein
MERAAIPGAPLIEVAGVLLADRDLAQVDRLAVEAVSAIDSTLDRPGVVGALRRSLERAGLRRLEHRSGEALLRRRMVVRGVDREALSTSPAAAGEQDAEPERSDVGARVECHEKLRQMPFVGASAYLILAATKPTQ